MPGPAIRPVRKAVWGHLCWPIRCAAGETSGKPPAIEEEPGGEVPTRLYKDAPIDADVRTSSHTTTPHHLSVRNASNLRYTVVLRCALPERSTGLCVDVSRVSLLHLSVLFCSARR